MSYGGVSNVALQSFSAFCRGRSAVSLQYLCAIFLQNVTAKDTGGCGISALSFCLFSFKSHEKSPRMWYIYGIFVSCF